MFIRSLVTQASTPLSYIITLSPIENDDETRTTRHHSAKRSLFVLQHWTTLAAPIHSTGTRCCPIPQNIFGVEVATPNSVCIIRMYTLCSIDTRISPTKEARISVDNFHEFLLAPILLSRTARLFALQSRSRALPASRSGTWTAK